MALQKKEITRKRLGCFGLGTELFLHAENIKETLRQRILGLRSTTRSNVPATRILSPLQRALIKCVTAYFLASLCTYVPHLSHSLARLLPNHDPDKLVPISNIHMIATVAVYFHPAKTVGAMLEADIYAVLGWLYALVVSVLSMGVAVFLHDQGLATLSNVLIVALFIGGGMGFVAWSKVRMASPTFSTTCSMIGIIVFTVVVREGSAHLGRFSMDKILQTTICVIAGTLISNLVCFLFWPQFATTNLQVDIRRNLTGFSTLLKVLTKTFLLDDPDQFYYGSDRIKRATEDHHASFTSLKKNLREAQLERLFDARIRGATNEYTKVTDSMNRLAQHLAGLRSSCSLQHRIMMQDRERELEKGQSTLVLENDSAKQAGAVPTADTEENSSSDGENSDEWRARANAFGEFVEFIGPHMRSLVVSVADGQGCRVDQVSNIIPASQFTCSRTLVNLRSTFLTAEDVPLPDMDADGSALQSAHSDTVPRLLAHFVQGSSFDLLNEDLRLAIKRFKLEQTVSIKRIYESTIYQDTRGLDKLEEIAAKVLQDSEIMPEEQVFLVFFFIFNLEEFAEELLFLIGALEDVRQIEERIERRKLMSWTGWLRDLFRRSDSSLLRQRRDRQRRRSKEKPLSFPDFSAHQADTSQTPRPSSFKMRFSQLVWSVGRFLKRADVRFAIKTGVGCAILAAPAFIHKTRHIFVEYRGQWGLISYMVVMR